MTSELKSKNNAAATATQALIDTAAMVADGASALPLSNVFNVVVLSGENTSVGKTMISREVLRPGLIEMRASCEFFQIEAMDRVLQEGAIRISTEDLPELFNKLVVIRARKRASITDIGGGQAESFFRVLQKNVSARSRIDLFVLPLVPGLEETKVISIIDKLISYGTDAKKLVVVFNKVNGESPNALKALIKGSYPSIINHAEQCGYRISNAFIPEAKIIADHGPTPEKTLYQTSSDETNYAALIDSLAASGASDEEIQACAVREWQRDEAYGIAGRMIDVFSDLVLLPA